MKVQPLTASHLSQIVAIENQSFTEPWSQDGLRALLSNPTFSAVGIFVGEKLAGYVFYYIAADELHVMNVAIHPDYRRQSLGEHLLSNVHQAAKQKKAKFAYLEVRETNEAAQKLYEKLGYQKLGRRIAYYSNREDALLLYKLLNEKN